MEAESGKVVSEAVEDQRSSADKLAEGVREIVRQELQLPPEKPATRQQLPNWKDACWLAIFIADAALVFSWFPEGAKGPLEFLGKFLPWLLGGLFVAANDWFRDRLLEISRARWLRAVQLIVLVVGLTFGKIQIPIMASVNPPEAHLFIDGKERAFDQKIWLPVGSHKVRISEGRDPNDTVAKDREFTLSWRQQLLDVLFFTGRKQDWSLTYSFSVMTPKICMVTVTKTDGPFDSDFLDSVHLQKLRKQNNNAVQFQSFGAEKDNSLELPYGHYVAQAVGCKPKQFSVDRNHVRDGLDLRPECSP